MVQMQQPGLVNAEMNAVWKQFLRTKVNSFIKWDLVRFFHDNPHTVDTAEHIAQFVGRDAKTVQLELDGLVKVDVLTRRNVEGVSVYRLSDDAEIRQLISNFVAACHNREFRVQAINHVIYGMGFSQSRNL
ncbi:MAG: hypothetical protein KC496_11895 [Anaerolineae bacterium]|nr:hypothetical protein [Anaerolineae bacterium]